MLYKLKTYPYTGPGKQRFVYTWDGSNTFYIACDEQGQEMTVPLSWIKENQYKIVNVRLNGQKLYYTCDRHAKALKILLNDFYARLMSDEGIRPFWEIKHINFDIRLKGNLKGEQAVSWAWGELFKEGLNIREYYVEFIQQAIIKLWTLGYTAYLYKTGKQKRSIILKRIIPRDVSNYQEFKPKKMTDTTLDVLLGQLRKEI